MIVAVDLSATPAAIALEAPDDFQGFHVAVRGGTPGDPRLDEAVARFGRGDGEHVFVDVAALRGLAGERAADPAWQASLEGMLGYARSKGWLDDEGAIQAHVEWDG